MPIFANYQRKSPLGDPMFQQKPTLKDLSSSKNTGVFKNSTHHINNVTTTDEAILKCERAADAADGLGGKELAEEFRDAANNLRGLKPFLDD